MSSTFTPQFAIGATVFHVSETAGVREGIVMMIVLNKTATYTTVKYDLNLKRMTTTSSSVEALEADCFATADLALASYKSRFGWA